MRKFMLAAAVLAVAACGEKAADEAPMEETTPATTEMPAPAPATTDSTTPAPAESTTAAPAAAPTTN